MSTTPMISKALESIQRYIPPHFRALAHAHPVATSVSAASAIAGIWWVVSDYSAWKSLGRGGAPYNVFGWLAARILGLTVSTPQRRIADTRELRRQLRETSRVRILDLPERLGVRPEVDGVVPQRQVSQRGSKAFQEDLNKWFRTLALAHPDVLFISRSINEGGTTEALFVHPLPSPIGTPTATTGGTHPSHRLPTPLRQNEIAHVHPIDGALHVPLSLPDVVEVLEKGWGVRHRLAGVGGPVDDGLTLIYSPRSVDEVEVVKTILRASVQYKTGQQLAD